MYSPRPLVWSGGNLVIGAQRVDLDPDFEELDLSHQLPQDLVRCEDRSESLVSRTVTAFTLRRSRLRQQRKAEAE